MKILFLGKRDDERAADALALTQTLFNDVTALWAKRGDRDPLPACDWSGDVMVSYLWPFVVKPGDLERAATAAINFHPGPPDYPGIGCTNFALYEENDTFGITCHHMSPRVDTGAIIAVRRFPITADDSVWTLTQRCYAEIATTFEAVMRDAARHGRFPESDEQWARRPFTRRELNALCRITADMDAGEVRRRIRAVTFPGAPGAFIDVHGFRFEHIAEIQEETVRG